MADEVDAVPVAGTPAVSRAWPRWLRAAEAGPLAGLLLLVVVFSLTAPYFATQTNFFTVLLQAAVIGILSIGQTFVILGAGIDLAGGSALGLSATTMGFLALNGVDPFVAIALGMLVGAAVGFLHGWVAWRFAVPPLIVTLGGLSLWEGVALQVTNGQNLILYGSSPVLTWLGSAYVGPIPVAVLLMLLLYAAADQLVRRHRIGIYIRAIGADLPTARRFLPHLGAYAIVPYVLSGLSAAIAGLVLIGRLGSAEGNMGSGMELDAIVAVVLGGTSLFGGRGGMWQTLLGAIVIAVMSDGLVMIGVSPFIQEAVVGVLIVTVVAVDALRRGLVTLPRIRLGGF